jgi:hypothetical protein
VLSVLALMLVLVNDVINYCSVNRLGLDTVGQKRLEGSTAVGIEGAYSITPLIRTLVIRIGLALRVNIFLLYFTIFLLLKNFPLCQAHERNYVLMFHLYVNKYVA